MIQIWEQKENLGKIHKRICAGFLSFVYTCIYTKMYCCLRSSYQEGRVGISTTFFSLSQARTWISNVICHGLFCVQWVQLRWEVIVDNGGIDDYHCLNFLCTTESMFLFILKVVPIRYFQPFLSVGVSVIFFSMFLCFQESILNLKEKYMF